MRQRTDTVEDFVLEERVRQAGYHYLAELFRDPAELTEASEVPALIGEIVEAIDDSELRRSSRQLGEAFNAADPVALRRDYTALFIGPQNLLAPPYGSIYLEPAKRQVMGESTRDAKRLYRQAGMKVSSEFKQPPDHIMLELRFMSHVVFGVVEELSADSPDWQRAGNLVKIQLEFLQRHLVAWIKPFTHLVLENSATSFYSVVAELTERFVAYDYQHAAPSMYEDFSRFNPATDSN